MQQNFDNKSILRELGQGVGCDRTSTGGLECNGILTTDQF